MLSILFISIPFFPTSSPGQVAPRAWRRGLLNQDAKCKAGIVLSSPQGGGRKVVEERLGGRNLLAPINQGGSFGSHPGLPPCWLGPGDHVVEEAARLAERSTRWNHPLRPGLPSRDQAGIIPNKTVPERSEANVKHRRACSSGPQAYGLPVSGLLTHLTPRMGIIPYPNPIPTPNLSV